MWYIILSLITAIYIISYLVIPSTFSGFIGSYIVRPLLWASLALLVFLIARREGLNIWWFKKIRKWEIGKTPFHTALLIGGFQISLFIIAGLLLGFGESPYSFTPFGIATNLLFVISALFGIELSRAYLIKKGTSSRRNITPILVSVTVFFMFISIAPTAFTSLDINTPAESVKFLGETVIPLLAMGLFASYLAYLGGGLTAIGYMGIIQGFQWFSPILPDINWVLMALIGTIGPAIGFLIIQNSIQLTQLGKRRTRKRAKMKDPALTWTGLAIVSLLIVFFSTGFLGVQPTIIYSGSMRPTMDVGDIVIITETPIDKIEVGDVIQYRTAHATIIHRVYEKYEKGNIRLFITKGDANNAPDSEPIFAEQVMGKAVFTIPKLGWIPIYIKEFFRSLSNIV